MGEGRRKQIDVFLAAADRGLELAVSTKTLALGVNSSGELLKVRKNCRRFMLQPVYRKPAHAMCRRESGRIAPATGRTA